MATRVRSSVCAVGALISLHQARTTRVCSYSLNTHCINHVVSTSPRRRITTDKAFLSTKKYCIFYLSYVSIKSYVMGTHKKRLAEALLMGTHNICLQVEVRKTLSE